jgi:hypothetical protein
MHNDYSYILTNILNPNLTYNENIESKKILPNACIYM